MKAFGITVMSLLLLCSCRSAGPLQRELNTMRSHLYYELTSPVYTGEVKHAVFMDIISSNINYYSHIERTGGYFIPLLFYNVQRDNFRILLGEHSLNMLYREFLTEALLTECNSSTCFDLVDNQDERVNPDTVYRLEVKIRKNETVGDLSIHFSQLLWFDGTYLNSESVRYHPSATDLCISLRLSRGCDCLFDKTYEVKHKQPVRYNSFYDTYDASQAAMNNMSRALSLATKEMVEQISLDLNLVMAAEAISKQVLP
ncbi:MAG: hypothetical protein LBL97_01110 [Prevotellaceae bacterium]|jgi:hypothetical protein|nr:hypothetical protein [Prevotellaceae bacterium]